uniref:INO80 complex subunit C n=1 Tax=Latimeria chalumnae TaxID=7897 RepID=H2ZWA5_LATCH
MSVPVPPAASPTKPPTSPLPPPAAGVAVARVKKRPASPGNSASGNNKKKKVTTAQTTGAEIAVENKNVITEPNVGPPEAAIKPLPFKDPNFVHSGIGGAAVGKKNRTWKNLKQILAAERTLPWQLNDPNYCNIDAPPSFKPAKKYSDVSGLLVSIHFFHFSRFCFTHNTCRTVVY